MSTLPPRIVAFHALADHPWYGQVIRRLSVSNRRLALETLVPLAEMPSDEYEYRVTRLFLGQATSKAHHAIVELLLTLTSKG